MACQVSMPGQAEVNCHRRYSAGGCSAQHKKPSKIYEGIPILATSSLSESGEREGSIRKQFLSTRHLSLAYQSFLATPHLILLNEDMTDKLIALNKQLCISSFQDRANAGRLLLDAFICKILYYYFIQV